MSDHSGSDYSSETQRDIVTGVKILYAQDEHATHGEWMSCPKKVPVDIIKYHEIFNSPSDDRSGYYVSERSALLEEVAESIPDFQTAPEEQAAQDKEVTE
jgi:hypothetical protein